MKTILIFLTCVLLSCKDKEPVNLIEVKIISSYENDGSFSSRPTHMILERLDTKERIYYPGNYGISGDIYTVPEEKLYNP